MEEILVFTYKGPKAVSRFDHAFTAGTKYKIEGLAKIGEENLAKSLKVTNVCSFYMMESISDSLKDELIDFILKNYEEVVETGGWVKLAIQKPSLIKAVFKTAMKPVKVD